MICAHGYSVHLVKPGTLSPPGRSTPGYEAPWANVGCSGPCSLLPPATHSELCPGSSLLGARLHPQLCAAQARPGRQT